MSEKVCPDCKDKVPVARKICLCGYFFGVFHGGQMQRRD